MSVSSAAQPLWTFTGDRRPAPVPFLVAGIVNLTPDSFSDGGRYVEPAAAMAHVRKLLADGAHMIDLGAESTRPGARDIGTVEEQRRLLPVLEQCLELRRAGEGKSEDADFAGAKETPGAEPLSGAGSLPGGHAFAVSVDTFRARTAAAALEQGAEVINDVSGGTFEPEMLDVLAQYKPGYVLGHSPLRPLDMQRNPGYSDVVEDLLRYFARRMDLLIKAGLPESRICLDPCIGFGKTGEHSLRLIACAERFAVLGRPLYYGVSRKSFLGEPTGYPSGEARDMHTQVVTACLARKGVRIHRVHDVRAAVATLRLTALLEEC